MERPRPIEAARTLTITAIGALLVTAAIGVWLRLGLGGALPLPERFTAVRHAHTHAGYYGVLFPLAWLAWTRLGTPAPGPRAAALYASATLSAVAGFALRGYALASIAASSVVGALWIASALRARARSLGWLRVVPYGIGVATLFVPPIGVLTRRAPELAQHLVRSFLTTLLLLVMLPTALATLRAAPPPALLWGGLALLSAGFLGALPWGPLGVALSVLGLVLARSVWRARCAWPLRAAWLATSMGFVALGMQGAPPPTHRAIAAVHALVLGPILTTLAPPGGALTWLSLLAAALMGASLASVELGVSGSTANLGAALAGILWLPAALVGVVARRSD